MLDDQTKNYIPPQSPVLIQPGDKGFETVGKAYNRWIWMYKDWAKRKKKIVNPDTNWDLNKKPMSQSEIKKKMKNLYLTEWEEFSVSEKEEIKGGLSSGMNLYDIAKHHDRKGYYDPVDFVSSLKKELEMGIKVEMEHTNSKKIAKEIAMDHLYEDPSYYTNLKKIEKD